MNIGYSNRTRYWQVYAFENPPEGIIYSRALDVPFHKVGINNPFLRHTKFMFPQPSIDMYHTYNSIVAGTRKPWVIEVESHVPRYGLKEGDKLFDWGVEKLRSDRCKAIIFTSEFTKKMNLERFVHWGIDTKKCHVVYRAVEMHEPMERFGEDKKFTILFVGNGFYRKGGIELIRAFKKFKKKNVRLVLISNFDVDRKIYPDKIEKQMVNDEIQKNPGILVFNSLPHSEVIDWMRKSDVFVSTTYADPFNNTILEALACGIPTIGSTVRATPEFLIDNFNGFSIDVNKNKKPEIVEFILEKIRVYYDNLGILKSHGENAKTVVKNKFLICHRNKALKDIYGSI